VRLLIHFKGNEIIKFANDKIERVRFELAMSPYWKALRDTGLTFDDVNILEIDSETKSINKLKQGGEAVIVTIDEEGKISLMIGI
jgi:hypothetical protein